MLLNSAIFVIFFLGGWLPFFFLKNLTFFIGVSFFFIFKLIFVACQFIIVRAILPRYRFDQLMDLCWKKILPMSCGFFLFFIFIMYSFDGFQYNLELDFLKPKNLLVILYTIL
jgi:NADH-quinone oxidoreductase subunit H